MAAENEYAAVCRSFPVLDGEKVGIVRLCSILHTSTQGETPKDGNCMFHAILDQIRYNSRLPDFAADQECSLPGQCHTNQYGRVESVIYRAKITRRTREPPNITPAWLAALLWQDGTVTWPISGTTTPRTGPTGNGWADTSGTSTTEWFRTPSPGASFVEPRPTTLWPNPAGSASWNSF